MRLAQLWEVIRLLLIKLLLTLPSFCFDFLVSTTFLAHT